MNEATRNLVRRRAGNRCEYCGRPQSESLLASLHIEHILPRKHPGGDDAENLALACIDCNLHKGTNVAGYDPVTGALTGLFHPRRQLWSDHFEWHGVLIVGITAVGRTTVDVLELNSPDRLELRAKQHAVAPQTACPLPQGRPVNANQQSPRRNPAARQRPSRRSSPGCGGGSIPSFRSSF